MRSSQKSVFGTLNAGPGNSRNPDILQPNLYSGHQQPGPADPGLPKASENTVYSVGAQAQPVAQDRIGQDEANAHGKKLGVAIGKPKVSPGFPAGVRK